MKSSEELIKTAKDDAITIMRWAKSCETDEQFTNVERFANDRDWWMNNWTAKDVNWWMGATSGFLAALRKTKFNLEVK